MEGCDDLQQTTQKYLYDHRKWKQSQTYQVWSFFAVVIKSVGGREQSINLCGRAWHLSGRCLAFPDTEMPHAGFKFWGIDHVFGSLHC